MKRLKTFFQVLAGVASMKSVGRACRLETHTGVQTVTEFFLCRSFYILTNTVYNVVPTLS